LQSQIFLNMRGLIFILILCFAGMSVSGQLAVYPELKLPAGYRLKSLPAVRDNSDAKYFPEVFMQEGWSCNQASSVGYLFTYEINAARSVPSTGDENLYPPLYVWNLLNDGNWEKGVSYFDSWEVIRTNGIPSVKEFGHDPNVQRWISGYDKYYQGMKNRITEVFSITVNNPDGLATLKHWMTDHLDGSPTGGLANFQIGSGTMKAVQIPDSLEQEGRYIMVNFDEKVGHAMTFVGWNDNVRHDFNGDGYYTNDIDINDDGKVDMRDWEIGAMLAVNSWGENWPGYKEMGRVYVPYRLLALDSWHGGIWTGTVTVVRPKKEYQPLLAFKASITYTKRNQIKVVAGVARNFAADAPEIIIEYPFFNFLGGNLPMQGVEGEGSESLEFGLDISPLLNYITPGMPAKFFLEVYHREGAGANGSGKIDYLSIMDYGTGTLIEEASPQANVGIKLRDVTRMAVIFDPSADPVMITNDETLPEARVGSGYSQVLQAEGGLPPYKWSNNSVSYSAEKIDKRWDFPAAERIIGHADSSRQVVNLGYYFPFYGKTYNQVTLLKNGGLIMGAYPKDYPYVIDPGVYIFQNAGIFPFYTDLKYQLSTDGIYRLDQEDGAVFAWDATLTRDGEVHDPKFGVKLFRDGRIETGYYTMAIAADWNWIAGISAGDMKNFTLPEINKLPLLLGGFKINYTTGNWPSWLFLSPTGSLLGIPEDGEARITLPVRVEDKQGLFNEKFFILNIRGTSGYELFSNESQIDVYPNPFTNWLTVSMEGQPGADAEISLFTVDGKKVYTKSFVAGAGTVELDLSGLKAKGTFFYQLLSGGRIYAGKLVRK